MDTRGFRSRHLHACTTGAVLALLAFGAQAQTIYRCKTPTGVVVTDRPCDGSQLRLPSAPSAPSNASRAVSQSDSEERQRSCYEARTKRDVIGKHMPDRFPADMKASDKAILVDEYARAKPIADDCDASARRTR